ncbi:MAG TPA: DinB family protein [Acidimicrobiia bacterium]|nr:DinB family protein [Acidimicrobiia bacterium]
MDATAMLVELYGRIPPLVRSAVDGLDAEALLWTAGVGDNSIGWLVWHLTRVQDHHVAELLDVAQVWTSTDWSGRFGLEPEPSNTGYGHSPEEAAHVRPDGAEALLGYFAEVDVRTLAMLDDLTGADYDRIVDRRWDPPVTLGVRLVSIADDSLQHLGQAAYLRGQLERSRRSG